MKNRTRMTAKQQAIASENVRIAWCLARRISPPWGMDFEEWQSEVFIAFCRAVMLHDPARGGLFTLARICVLSHRSRLSKRLRSKKTRDAWCRRVFLENLLNSPTPTEDDFAEEFEKAAGLVRSLPERNQVAIHYRCLGETFAEVAERINLSKEGARNLITRTLSQLRLAASGNGQAFPAATAALA